MPTKEKEGKKELPIDYFELEFISNKPDPRMKNRDQPLDEDTEDAKEG